MTLVSEPVGSAPTTFSVTTLRHDRWCVQLALCGHLDAGTAAVLAATAEGHLRAGRRFLRVDVGAVAGVDADAAAILGRLHLRLLSGRGTLVLTGVRPELERALTRTNPELLLSPPTAAAALAHLPSAATAN